MKKTIELTLEIAKECYGKDKTIDTILLANFPELNKPQLPKRYECLGKIKGFFIDNNSVIWEFKKADSNIYNDKNIHKTVHGFVQVGFSCTNA